MNIFNAEEISLFMKILPYCISGLFAIIGIIVGAKITQKSQINHLITDKKIEMFSKFLDIQDICFNKANKYILSTYKIKSAIKLKIIKSYDDLFIHINKIKLLLKNKDSDLIADYSKKIVKLHTQIFENQFNENKMLVIADEMKIIKYKIISIFNKSITKFK